MPTSTHRNYRNQRNNPYRLDDLAVTFHRSTIGVFWRWRTEVTVIMAAATAAWRLSHLIPRPWAVTVVGTVLAGLACLPWSRKRLWCLLARHRVHRLCWEARLHTRAGRLPLVLSARPTRVGERLHVLCRAGICADDFDAHRGELAAACFARDARVARHPRWSHLVTIDIIRRDTLAASNTIPSPLTATVTPALTTSDDQAA